MKMGIKEFRERISHVASGEQPVAVTHRGRVVGHYLPVAGPRVEGDDLDGWLDARRRFRERWIGRDPQWAEKLSEIGLDRDGEPADDAARR